MTWHDLLNIAVLVGMVASIVLERRARRAQEALTQRTEAVVASMGRHVADYRALVEHGARLVRPRGGERWQA